MPLEILVYAAEVLSLGSLIMMVLVLRRLHATSAAPQLVCP
ncbi:MAG: hypothetical protein FD153_1946 [Rhodospirillaceae bacterium]|nr:MAG: hypothetical protein FD153_1946 [Rhodospirillaceae bacterium]